MQTDQDLALAETVKRALFFSTKEAEGVSLPELIGTLSNLLRVSTCKVEEIVVDLVRTGDVRLTSVHLAKGW